MQSVQDRLIAAQQPFEFGPVAQRLIGAQREQTFTEGFDRGLLSSAGSLLKSATLPRRIVTTALEALGADPDTTSVVDALFRSMNSGNELAAQAGQAAQDVAETIPQGTQTFASNVGNAAGSALALAPTSIAGGPVLTGAVSAAQEASDLMDEAKAKGASPQRQLLAALAGAPLGATEAFGAEQALGKLGKVFMGAPRELRTGIVSAIVGELVKSGAGEAGEELAQGLGEQAVRQWVIQDPQAQKDLHGWLQEFGDTWINQGLPAGIVGMIMGGMAQAGQIPMSVFDRPAASGDSGPGGATGAPAPSVSQQIDEATGKVIPAGAPQVAPLNEQLAAGNSEIPVNAEAAGVPVENRPAEQPPTAPEPVQAVQSVQSVQNAQTAQEAPGSTQAPQVSEVASEPPSAAQAATEVDPIETLKNRYKPDNPFAEKAARARLNYERLSQPSARDEAMAQSFPLGTGYGRPGGERRVEQTIDRAVAAQAALREAQHREAQAQAFDAGRINAQGRATSPEAQARAEKRQRDQRSRNERFEAAKAAREGKEPWQVTSAIYSDSAKVFGGNPLKFLQAEHRQAVADAIAQGKAVPVDVLAEYPDLIPPEISPTPLVEIAPGVAVKGEQGLFGAQEKAPKPAPTGPATPSVTQPNLIDIQKGDLKGQTSLIDIVDAEKEAQAAEKAKPQTKPRRSVRAEAAAGELGFRAWVRQFGGIRSEGALAQEADSIRENFSDEKVVGLGPLVHKRGEAKGVTLESLVEDAIEAGFLREGSTTRELIDLIESDITPQSAARMASKQMREQEAELRRRLKEEGWASERDFREAMAQADRESEGADIPDVELAGSDVPFSPERDASGANTTPPPDPVSGAQQEPLAKIGDSLRGRLESPGNPIDPTSAPDVIDALSKVIAASGGKTPIRWGRIRRRMQASGYFAVQPEIIRVRVANNIATAAHEVFHALEKHIYGWEKGGAWKNPNVAKPLQAELVALGKALYGDRKPAGGYKREGFAEYGRLYVTEPDLVASKAPQFHAWFEGQFLKGNPEIAAALKTARDTATRYRMQGSTQRAKASIVDPTSLASRWKRFKRGITWARATQLWTEAGQPLQEFQEAALKVEPNLDPTSLPYNTLRSLRLVHDARVAYMVEHGMIDLAGNRVGPALIDIRKLIEGRGSDFAIYLWAKRSLALAETGRNSGLSIADAKQIVKELDSPKMQLAAAKLYEWQDGVLDYLSQASPYFRDIVSKIRAADPGYYIPLQREFDEFDKAWAHGGAKGGSSPVKRLKGSGRRIKNPIPQILSNTRKLVLLAHQRRILDQVIRLRSVEGMGRFVEEVPVDQVKLGNQTVEQMLTQISKALRDEGLGVALTQGGEVVEGGSGLDRVLEESLPFFGDAQRPDTKDPVIPYFDGDRVRWFQLDSSLYRTLAQLDIYRLPKIVDLLLGAPTRVFRAGTTGLRAAFGLITNPIRDLQTLYLNSRAHHNGGALFGTWLKSMAEAAAYRAGLGHNAWFDAFLSLGGEMAQPLGQDIPHTARAARKLTQGIWARTMDPRNWFDWYRDFVQFPEAAARVTELKLVARDIGWKPGEPMTVHQAQQLLIATKSATTDFTAAGELARVTNQIVPFFNAAIQGPRASLQALRDHPQRFVWRGLQLTAATVALWMLNRDEDWWKETPDDEKFNFWQFPITIGGRTEIVRLPRAFDTGGAFAALPEALLDSWYREDPEAATAWAKNFVAMANPLSLPQSLREPAEQLANKDFFSERPIVPQGEQHRAPEEQSGPFTTRLAQFLGETFGMSPRRIDHAIKGTFGPVASDVVQALGLGSDKAGAREGPSDVPVVGRLFRPGGARISRPKSVDKLYDLYEHAVQRQASTRIEETPAERNVRLMLEDATKAVSALSFIRWESTDETKRQEAYAEMVRMARSAIEAAEAGSAHPKLFEANRRAAERQKERIKQTGQPTMSAAPK